MSAFDDIFASIPLFTRHKVARKMKREYRMMPPERPLTPEQQDENNRIAELFDKWSKEGKVFTIPDTP